MNEGDDLSMSGGGSPASAPAVRQQRAAVDALSVNIVEGMRTTGPGEAALNPLPESAARLLVDRDKREALADFYLAVREISPAEYASPALAWPPADSPGEVEAVDDGFGMGSLHASLPLVPQAGEEAVMEAAKPDGGERPVQPLRPREMAVLRQLAKGSTNRQIGAELGITEQTVKNYTSALYAKLGLRTRLQAVLWAMEQLGTGPDPATAHAADESAGQIKGPGYENEAGA